MQSKISVNENTARIKSIQSDKEYREYLKVIDSLVDSADNSPGEVILELVSALVEDYESKHFPIEPPDFIGMTAY